MNALLALQDGRHVCSKFRCLYGTARYDPASPIHINWPANGHCLPAAWRAPCLAAAPSYLWLFCEPYSLFCLCTATHAHGCIILLKIITLFRWKNGLFSKSVQGRIHDYLLVRDASWSELQTV